MIPEDAPAVKRHLDSLSSIFGRKAPNEVAVTAWFQHLREYPIEVITWAMDRWPADHDYFPTIAQMRKLVGDEHARRCSARDRRLESVDASQWRQNASQTAIGREALQRISQIKATRKPPAMTWALRLRKAEECGAVLSLLQRRLWREALGVKSEPPPPETDDDREARLEREAIQTEAVMP